MHTSCLIIAVFCYLSYMNISYVVLIVTYLEITCPICFWSLRLQYEATRALTNITLGTSENIKVVVAHGAVPFFVKLLMSPHEDIVEQA